MFARSIFNFMCIAMVFVHAVVDDDKTKMSFLSAIFLCLFLYALGARPYRNSHSNAVFIGLNLAISLTAFELTMKISGFKSTLFVDKYFYWM